jgi:hypothetical protein
MTKVGCNSAYGLTTASDFRRNEMGDFTLYKYQPPTILIGLLVNSTLRIFTGAVGPWTSAEIVRFRIDTK